MKLTFQFDSLSAFWQMAGHGPYVWAAYAITFVGIAGIILHTRAKRRTTVKKINTLIQHEQSKTQV